MLLLLGAGMRTSPVAAQQHQPSQPGSIPPVSQPQGSPHMPGLSTVDNAPDPMKDAMHEQMLRDANVQRHKKMLDDANKMVQLSNELKADVEKTQKDELSLEVLKKAAEVEKLAHDVQQRMKQ
jgi:hypothetical protein